MLLVISIFHFNPILTPFLNYGLNATQNLYMFAVDLGGLFFLHILDMATGKCFTDYQFAVGFSPPYTAIGGTQTLFRDFVKFWKFQNLFRSSC